MATVLSASIRAVGRLAVCCAAVWTVATETASAVPYQTVSVQAPGLISGMSIGTYEVTVGQYCAFLNKVASQDDKYGLYSSLMGTGTNGGITRTGTTGSWAYGPRAPQGLQSSLATLTRRPVTYVSWLDATRFANWMHNGQGAGSTESGAYDLSSFTGDALEQSANALYWIPKPVEWRTAAYWSPTLNSGSGGFWNYATQSNTAPGNTSATGTNQANFRSATNRYTVTQSSGLSANQNYLTDVGRFRSAPSFFGTFDQSGNVAEWTTTSGTNQTPIQGGSWRTLVGDGISARSQTTVITNESDALGFRLAKMIRSEKLIHVATDLIRASIQHPLDDPMSPWRKTGGGTLILDEATDLTEAFTSQEGTVRLSHVAALGDAVDLILTGGTVAIDPGVAVTIGNLHMPAITNQLIPRGLLDVGEGMLTVADALDPTDLVSWIIAGRGDGSWNGAGGITSTAATASGGSRAVGWIDNGDGSLMVGFAAAGDTNLDGTVDILDVVNFLRLDNFDKGRPAIWAEGDFNYDEKVDVLDVVDFISRGLFDAGPYCSWSPQSATITAVPEPSVLAVAAVGVAMLGVFCRRR